MAAAITSLLIVGYVVGIPPFGPSHANHGSAATDSAAGMVTALGGDQGGRLAPADRPGSAPVVAPPALVPPPIARQGPAVGQAALGTTHRLVGHDPAEQTDHTAGNRSLHPTTAAGWRAVLESVDARRQRAWHQGDPAALSAVFVSGSAELAADRRALFRYVRRGLHVDGVATSYRVLAVDRIASGSATLLVVDRLGHAVARDDAGHHVALPDDLPTRHRVTLRLVEGAWLIAAVANAT